MANQQQLALLRQGVDAWNAWRLGRENAESNPDLSEADLRGMNLNGIILIRANMIGSDLRGAQLAGANLRETSFCQNPLAIDNVPVWWLRGAGILTSPDAPAPRASFGTLTDFEVPPANLSGANLHHADLTRAYLYMVDLVESNLRKAQLYGSNLSSAKLTNVNLSGAKLCEADLRRADLSGADLRGANLEWVNLSEANLNYADITGCSVYAISAWSVLLENTVQSNLIITSRHSRQYRREALITVDNLEVAQFIYLLLSNEHIRDVINTITSKVVLILGRFTPERKDILDAVRAELRKRNYLPVLFDFEKPTSRDITETVSTLAHMARFVIADITDAKSIPQELMAIVPHLPSVPVQPILQASAREYGMFEHFPRYPWVLPLYRYRNQGSLLQSLNEHIIDSAERKAQELEKR